MKIRILALLLLLPMFAHAESYQLVRIPLSGPVAAARLMRMGLALEEGVRWTARGVDLILSESEASKLRTAGFAPVVLQPDMAAFYRSRLQAKAADSFAIGKMGGFYTFSEALTRLQTFHQKYPSIFSAPIKIGSSVEGRPIYAYKMSDSVEKDERDEPEVLYTALHHAREPESLMCVMYFIEQMLQGYGKNPEITYVVDHRQLWFIPVINPDGYVYNEQMSPAGGGLWRKNRRNNGDGSFGVDLNRNYSYAWGYDDQGSSATTGDEAYRGSSAFSEPETAAVRGFVSRRRFVLAMNFHSYQDAVLYPWSYTSAVTPHQAIFSDLSSYLVRLNHYVSGTTFQVLRYFANGDSDDWLYGGRPGARVFGMTTEVGNFGDNFWPPSQRILPLAKENFASNLSLAWMAGGYPVVRDIVYLEDSGESPGLILAGHRYTLAVTLHNLGVRQAVAQLSMRLTSPSKSVEILQGTTHRASMKPLKFAAWKDLVIRVSPQATRDQVIPLTFWMYAGDTLLRKETVKVTVDR